MFTYCPTSDYKLFAGPALGGSIIKAVGFRWYACISIAGKERWCYYFIKQRHDTKYTITSERNFFPESWICAVEKKRYGIPI